MRNPGPGSAPPKIQVSDSLKVDQLRREIHSKTEEAIWEAIQKMSGVGEDAEKRYQAAIEALRQDAKEVVAAVRSIYERVANHPYVERWAMVQMLADLNRAESLPLLEAILSSPLPSGGQEKPNECGNTNAASLVRTTGISAEVIIRTTAIEAVERLAGERHPRALEILLKNTRHTNFSVKRAAIQAYLGRGGPGAREVLLKELPEQDHYILTIRRVTVHQISQPHPGVCGTARDPNQLPQLRKVD